MTDTFLYIASQVNTTLVLENVGDEPDVPLALKEQRNDHRQLWKWNSNGNLANKHSKYVMDVKTSLVKRKKTVIATVEKDDSNQGWYIMDGHIISYRNDLALEIDGMGGIMINKLALNASQKWYFVPYNVWGQFENAYRNTIPMDEANFWAQVAINYTPAMIGCSILEYQQRVQECASAIKECAETLNSVARKTGIARVAGGSAAIASGGAAITGIALAPFSAGTSLVFSIGGIVLGFRAGVTSATTTIIDEVFYSKKKKNMRRIVTPALSATLCLHNLLGVLSPSIRKAHIPIKNPNAIDITYKTFKIGSNTLKVVYDTGICVKNVVNLAKDIKGIETLGKTAGALSNLKALRTCVAAKTAAQGFHLGKKTIIASGSTAAKGISGSLAVVGIAFGIWDVCSGAKQIKNKNELANVFLKAVEDIQNDAKQLLDRHSQVLKARGNFEISMTI